MAEEHQKNDKRSRSKGWTHDRGDDTSLQTSAVATKGNEIFNLSSISLR